MMYFRDKIKFGTTWVYMNIAHCATTQPGMNEKRVLAVLQSLSKFVTELTHLRQCYFYDTITGQIDGNSLLLKLSFLQRIFQSQNGERICLWRICCAQPGRIKYWNIPSHIGVQLSPAKLRSCWQTMSWFFKRWFLSQQQSIFCDQV